MFSIPYHIICDYVICSLSIWTLLSYLCKENTNEKKPKKKLGYPDSWTCGHYPWHYCGVMDLE